MFLALAFCRSVHYKDLPIIVNDTTTQGVIQDIPLKEQLFRTYTCE